MRVAVFSDRYPPDWCAGAEMMLHETLVGLRARGHEIRLYVNHAHNRHFDGFDLLRFNEYRTPDDIIASCDVLITQLQEARPLLYKIRKRMPVVFLSHIDNSAVPASVGDNALVVCNSETMLAKERHKGPKTVMYPICHGDRYKTKRGNAITLINLNENKGGNHFYRIAAAMPDHEFLGVVGAYGRQIKPPKPLPNVTIIGHTSNMRNVYAQTRVLLVASRNETWGRVIIEAAHSGIPTIASNTSAGIREALGNSGIIVDRDDINAWADAIRSLDDPATYRRLSQQATRRAKQLDPNVILDKFENDVINYLQNFS